MRWFLGVLLLLCFAPALFAQKADRALQQELVDLRRIADTNNKILAETVQAVNQLRLDLQTLSGEIEAAKHFVDERGAKNDTVLREFDNRLTGIEERFSLHTQQLQELLSSQGGQPANRPAATGEELSDYQQALAEVNQQNYKKALGLFDQFLKKYPKGSLADNAQYWKGECLFAVKDYAQAILEFEKVNKNYPRSAKGPGSRLKQGYALYEMKAYPDAKAFLQKLLVEAPKSEEATMARERIEKIDQLLATHTPTTGVNGNPTAKNQKQ